MVAFVRLARCKPADTHTSRTSQGAPHNSTSHPALAETGAVWGLDRIDSATGRDGSYNYGTATGAAARVCAAAPGSNPRLLPPMEYIDRNYRPTARLRPSVQTDVLDTGVRVTHTDFGGRVLAGYSAGCVTGSESECGNTWGYQGVIDSALASSGCNGHGTHVASTVGGTTYGVAKEVTMVAVQVLSCSGSGSLANVIAGIEWSVTDAASSGQHSIITMSLGGGSSESENQVGTRAHTPN